MTQFPLERILPDAPNCDISVLLGDGVEIRECSQVSEGYGMFCVGDGIVGSMIAKISGGFALNALTYLQHSRLFNDKGNCIAHKLRVSINHQSRKECIEFINMSNESSGDVWDISAKQLLVLALIECLKDSRLIWHRYTKSLPRHPQLPLFILSNSSDSSSSDMLHPLITDLAKQELSSVRQDYQKLLLDCQKWFDSSFSFDWSEYLWACCMVKSRSFHSLFHKTALKQQQQLSTKTLTIFQTNSEFDELFEWIGKTPCMLPVLDLLNHDPRAQVEWRCMEDGSIEFHQINSVSSPCHHLQNQLFNNYGQKGNEELLLSYGFCIDPHVNERQRELDYVRLTVAQMNDNTAAEQFKTIYLHGGDNRKELSELIELVFSCLFELEEEEDSSSCGNNNDFITTIIEHGQSYSGDWSCDLEAMTQVQHMLQDKLEKITANANVSTIPALSDALLIYIDSQKQILNDALTQLDKVYQRASELNVNHL